MMTQRIWALTMSALALGACSGDAETAVTGDATLPTEMAGTTSQTATTTGSAGTSAAGASTNPPTQTAAPSVSTGSSANTMDDATAGAGTGGAAGVAGSAGSAADTMTPGAAATGETGAEDALDDADAGVADPAEMDEVGEGDVDMTATPDAGMPGTLDAGAAGMDAPGDTEATAPTVPAETADRGPWPVGVRTVNLELGAGLTPVEVWYPAQPGSDSERAKVNYDLTAWLPPEHGIPTDAPKVQIGCDCYRDLPPDTEHGPFPVVVVVHGQASFRAAFASQMTHWASRGFIAIAADHPGLVMRDTLAPNGGCSGTGIGQDFTHTRDIPALFRALGQPEGIFAFLNGVMDLERVALGGHGDGAAYVADNVTQPGVKALLSFSDDTAMPTAETLSGAFFLSGMSDKIVGYNNVVRAAETTARQLRPTLLAGMGNVGHLGFTDLCSARNSDGQDAIAMARRYNICGGATINVVDEYFWDCPLSPLAGPDNYLDQAATTALVQKLSTLALEELLLGETRTQQWNTLGADSSWGELRQTR